MDKRVKRDSVKKVFALLINFIISVSVYKLILLLGDKVNVMFYYCGVTLFVSTIAVLFCVFYAKNGYSFSNVKLSENDLPDEMTDDEKKDFIEKRVKSRRQAEKLILIILPMVLTVLMNYIEMIVTDILSV